MCVCITSVVLNCQDNCAYPLEFDNHPGSADLFSVGCIQGSVIYIDVKIGIDIVSAPLIPESVLC